MDEVGSNFACFKAAIAAQAKTKRREEAERARRDGWEGAESEEEVQDDGEASLAELLQADTDSAIEEEEPSCFEEGMLQDAQQVDSPPLTFLQSTGLASGKADKGSAWRDLLDGREVRMYCGTSKEVLQALFHSMCHGGCMDAQAAYDELSAHFQATSSNAGAADDAPAWAPSLSELWDSLCAIGYQAPVEDSDGGAGPSHGTGRPTAPQADAPAGVPKSQQRVPNLQLLLLLLKDMRASAHPAAAPGLLKGSAAGVVVAKQLLLAVHRMRLEPLLLSSLLNEFNVLREALVEAWAASHEHSWRAAEPGVATDLAAMGPSHSSALDVLTVPLSSRKHMAALSQAAALMLLRKLLGRPDEGQAAAAPGASKQMKEEAKSGQGVVQGAGARSEALVEELHALMGEARNVPTLLASCARSESDRRPDFWKARSVVQAADGIMWSAQVAHKLSPGAWNWYSEELKALEEKLGRLIQAAGVRKAQSAIKNNHDFERS
ncbi:hypothetical protein FOA52_000908 [Chlamydomonas sp. UWO 241]|nr:hypothetical protein FOA52_000908 [Chlamydomonas sp. UWO 241]